MNVTTYRLMAFAAVALSVGPAAIMAQRAPAPGSAQDAAAVATPPLHCMIWSPERKPWCASSRIRLVRYRSTIGAM